MRLSHSQSKISTRKLYEIMKYRCRLSFQGYRNRTVWLAPLKSVKHKGYENTATDIEISIQQLHKECLILAKGKFLKLNKWLCKTAEIL